MQDKVLMIDEILAGKEVLFTERLFSMGRKEVTSSNVIDISNVLPVIKNKYVDTKNQASVMDCENVRPAFDNLWVDGSFERFKFGVRVTAVSWELACGTLPLRTDTTKNTIPEDYFGITNRDDIDNAIVLLLSCFGEFMDTFAYFGAATMTINNNGKCVSTLPIFTNHHIGAPDSFEEWAISKVYTCAMMSLFAIQFMNCKNVSLQENTPSDKFRKARFKRHGVEPVKYHTIHLDPFGAVKHTGESTGNGFKKSLHICRGHFSTYTEEKPLFGKYSGTYWIPAHVRGDKELGVVKSRYDFKEVK